jgi:DNA-binding PadR family transcriptional regulator
LVRLVALGLVEQSGGPKRKIISLTQAGLDHPAYKSGSKHVRTRGALDLVKPEFVAILLAIDRLRLASGRAIMAAAHLDDGRAASGQLLLQLRLQGFIAQIRTGEGKAPSYQLTSRGASIIQAAHAQACDR